jgi:hypothetical protein
MRGPRKHSLVRSFGDFFRMMSFQGNPEIKEEFGDARKRMEIV